MKDISFAILALFITLLFACNQDEFNTSTDAKLDFSLDTLRFDTVFTTHGSATRSFKVINPHNQRIKISDIRLQNGNASFFRLNIDGVPTNQASDVEIAAKDSIYVFAEVTINPNAPLSSSPFVVEEKVIFTTNGNTQHVLLEAWGQNANYLPNRNGAGGAVILSCNMSNLTWDDPKPYVIYGILVVDSCQLNIPAGTRIYIHGGIQKSEDGSPYNDGLLYFAKNGKLNIQGTKTKPVNIQSDRLESEFEDIQGQWAGIRLSEGSGSHQVNYAIIKNSIIGIRVDSAATLALKNTHIYNAASSGILGLQANITAENCLINDCGGNSVQLEYGGNYSFQYCTMASYGVQAEALRVSNAFCLDQLCGNFRSAALQANFQNCVIYGSNSDEIDIFKKQSTHPFNYQFANCVVKTKDLITSFPDFYTAKCTNCINGKDSDKLFVEVDEKNYHLDSLAIAKEKALPLPNITKDLEDNPRDASRPDIGAFERVE